MKKILILTILFLNSATYAEESTIQCKEDGTQQEMNKCAYDGFQKADKELNRVYVALRKAKKEDELFLKNLTKAQKAWLKFRDLELASQFTCKSKDIKMCFGSMYNLSYFSSKSELTKQRVKTLSWQLEASSL